MEQQYYSIQGVLSASPAFNLSVFFFLFCVYGCIESAQLLVFMCVILISTKDIAALCAKIWKNSALVPTYLIWEFFCLLIAEDLTFIIIITTYLISASTLRSVLKCKIYCLANKDVMYLLVTYMWLIFCSSLTMSQTKFVILPQSVSW